MVTADLLQLYGVDVGDDALMRARPWSWLMSLIGGCMTARSRLGWDRMGPDQQQRHADAMGQGAQVTPWL